jgi:hypothetical protein
LLVVVVWHTPNPAALGHAFRSALGWELVLALLLNFAVVGLKVWRWQWLLAADGIDYGFVPAWRAFNAASYIALLTPGRLGDVLRVSYLRRDRRVTTARGLASVVLDRLFDVLVLAVCAGLGVVWFGSVLYARAGVFTWAGVAALGAACAGALSLLRSEAASEWLVRRLLSRFASSQAPSTFVSAARASLSGAFGKALLLTVAAFAVVYTQGYLLARGLGAQLSVFDVVSLNALVTLFGLLPVSVSGVGVRELLLSALFPALGLSATLGVAYGLLIFGVLYLPMVLYGLYVWQRHPL